MTLLVIVAVHSRMGCLQEKRKKKGYHSSVSRSLNTNQVLVIAEQKALRVLLSVTLVMVRATQVLMTF